MNYSMQEQTIDWLGLQSNICELADLIPRTSAEHFSIFQLIVLVLCPVTVLTALISRHNRRPTAATELVVDRMNAKRGVEQLASEEPDPTSGHKAGLWTRDDVGWMYKWLTVFMKRRGLMVNI